MSRARIPKRLIRHPEMRLLLFIVGFPLLSWPVFHPADSHPLLIVLSLFLFWAVCIFFVFLARDGE